MQKSGYHLAEPRDDFFVFSSNGIPAFAISGKSAQTVSELAFANAKRSV